MTENNSYSMQAALVSIQYGMPDYEQNIVVQCTRSKRVLVRLSKVPLSNT